MFRWKLFIKSLFSPIAKSFKSNKRKPLRRKWGARPLFEQLETRVVPTTLTTQSYTTAGAAYTQNFDSITSPISDGTGSPSPNAFDLGTGSGTNTSPGGSSLTGWSISAVTALKFDAQDVSQNGTLVTTGQIDDWSNGTSGSPGTNRALGMGATSSSGVETIALELTNNTGGTLSQATVSYLGEQWGDGTTVGAKTLDFGYDVASSAGTTGSQPPAVTAVSTLNFTGPITTGVGKSLDGTLSANQQQFSNVPITITGGWANGQVLWLTWTINSNTSQGPQLAIDNFSFSASAATTTTVSSVSPLSTTATGGVDSPSVTFQAQVAAPTGVAAPANGSVGFYNGATLLATTSAAPSTSSNVATFSVGSISNIPVGNYNNITAVYTPAASNGFLTSTSTAYGSTLTVAGPLTLGTFSGAATWTEGEAYSGTIAVSGGTSPYFLGTVTGLPNGLTAALSGSTITISGTPTASGTFSSVVVPVTDSGSGSVSQTDSLTLNVPINLGSLGSTSLTEWVPYSSTITVSGGTTPYALGTVTGLPAGLSASLSGSTITISGTPAASGTFSSVVVPVTDSVSASGSQTDSLTVGSGAVFTGGQLAVLETGTAGDNDPGSILEVNPSTGQLNLNYSIPYTTGSNAFQFDGGNSKYGFLSDTNDGTLISFDGANSTNTATAVKSITTRGVGTVASNLSLNVAATYTETAANEPRGATSVDNSTWYITDQGGLYTGGATTASLTTNILDAKSFGGIVYIGSANATDPVSTVSSTTATSLTALPTSVTALTTVDANFRDFYLISSGSNGTTFDVMYILDSSSATVGTISKYSLVSGSWVSNGSVPDTFGGSGLAAASDGSGGAYLYVTTGQATAANELLALHDTAGYNTTISSTTASGAVTLYTAPAGTTMMGVAFAPLTAISTTTAVTTVTGNQGNPATLTATVTVAPGTAGPSTGYVQFYSGGTLLGTTTAVPTVSSNVATFTFTGTLGVGAYSNIQADYISGGGGYASSNSVPASGPTVTVSAAPTVNLSTAHMSNAAATLTIAGANFDSATPGNNVVTFSGAGSTGITGSVTSVNIAGTSLTYTFTADPTSLGELDALVTTDSVPSSSAIQVATVVVPPTVTSTTTNSVADNVTSLTINGTGFDGTAINDTVTFSNGVTGTVNSATTTSLTVGSLSGLTAVTTGSPLNASVTVDGLSTGTAVEVATVAPQTISYGTGTYLAGSTYNQTFSTLPNTSANATLVNGTDSTVSGPYDLTSSAGSNSVHGTGMAGWYAANLASGAESFGTGTPTAKTGSLYDFSDGTNEALGTVSTSSVSSRFGAIFTNTSSVTLTTFTLSYTGEEWWNNNGSGTSMNFAYEVGTGIGLPTTGTGTAVSQLGFTAASTSGTGQAVDGATTDQSPVAAYTVTITGGWAPGQNLVIFWDKGAAGAGSSAGLAVANVNFSAHAAPPTVATNTGVTASLSQSVDITSSMLHSTDPNGYAASQLTYTVTSLPTNGTLFLNGAAQTVTGGTFTEAQLATGTYVSFTGGSTTGTGSFGFSVADPSSAAATGAFATIVGTPPVLAVNAGLTVIQGATAAAITTSDLQVTDGDGSVTDSGLFFTIATAPLYGTLSDAAGSSNPGMLTAGSTFTEQDLDSDYVTYANTGTTDVATASDSFTFTVLASDTGTLGSTTFDINVHLLPVLAANTGVDTPVGATTPITSSLLKTNGQGTTSQILYTLTSVPTSGNLYDTSSATPTAALAIGSTFTQHEISQSSGSTIEFVGNSAATSDSFGFTVTDTSYASQQPSVSGTFAITSNPALSQAAYTFTGSPYTQSFGGLPTGVVGTESDFAQSGPFDLGGSATPATSPQGVGATGMTGWSMAQIGGTTTNEERFLTDNGSTSTGGVYAYSGSAAPVSGQQALGLVSSPADQSAIGLTLVNNTSATLTQFTLTYDGEEWRIGKVDNPLDVSYQIGVVGVGDATSGDWTTITGAGYDGTLAASAAANSAVTDNPETGTVTGLSWAPGQTLVIRWTQAAGVSSGEGLGITNVSFAAMGSSSISVTSANETYSGGGYVPTVSESGSGGAVTYAYYDGTGTGGANLGSTAPINVGSYTVVASVAADANYTAATSSPLPFQITQLGITDSGFAVNSKPYDGTAAATISANGTLSGVLGGDTANVSLVSSGAGATFDNANAGTTHTVTASGYTLSGSAAGNYSLTQPSESNVTISPLAITDSGFAVNSKPYDGTTAATISNDGSLSGVLNGDTANVTLDNSGASATFDNADAGTTHKVTASRYTLSGSAAGNYSLTQPSESNVTIGKAALTVTGITANNKTYDGTDSATVNTSSAVLHGAATGDTGITLSPNLYVYSWSGYVEPVAGQTNSWGLSGDGSALTTTDGTPYTISVAVDPSTTARPGNGSGGIAYFIPASVNLQIGGVAATVGSFAGSSTLGLELSYNTASFGFNEIAFDDDVTFNGTTMFFSSSNRVALTTFAATDVPVLFASPAALVQNGADDAGSVFTFGGPVSVTGAAGTFASPNVGTGTTVQVAGVTIGGTTQDGTAASADYTLTQPTTTANITPLGITDSGFAVSNKPYDGTAAATISNNGSLSGVLGGDTANVSLVSSGASATFDNANAGTTHTVTASGYTLSGSAAGNYSLTQPTASNVTISPLGITDSGFAVNSKPYDGTTAATISANGTLSGVLNGDTANVSLVSSGAIATFDNANAGTTHTVTASGYTLSGSAAGNYSLTQPSESNVTISPLGITDSGFAVSSKPYDGTTSATISANGTLSGVLNGDTANVSLVSSGAIATFDNANAGTTHTVTASGYTLSGSAAGNYSLTQPTASNVTISPLGITDSGFAVNSKPFDGTTAATISANGTLSGVLGGDTANVSLVSSGAGATFDNANAGTTHTVTASGYTLSGSAAGNYSLTQPTASNVTISPLGITDSGFAVNSKPYDGTTAATISANGTLSGVLNGDTANVTLVSSGASATFDNANAGTTHTVTASGYTLSGSAAGNYSLTQPSESNVTIAKATPSVSVTDAGGTSNGSPYAATAASVTGVGSTSLASFGSPTLSYTYVGTGSTTYASSSTAPSAAGTYTVTATYTSTNANYGNASSTAVPFTISAASAPTFAHSSYAFTPSETSTKGSTIGPVVATPNSAVTGQMITYSLTGTNASDFTISSAGVIKVASALDLDVLTQPNGGYSFNVVATGSKPSGMPAASVPVTVTVQDSLAIADTTPTVNVKSNVTVAALAKVAITDPITTHTEAVTVTLANTALGSLTIPSGNGFVAGTSPGTYTFSGTAAAATTAIDKLVFVPTANLVAPNDLTTEGFTIAVNDTNQTVTNSSANVVTADVYAGPNITGAVAAAKAPATNGNDITDHATATPFSAVLIADPDVTNTTYSVTPTQQTVAVTVTYAGANGTLADPATGYTGLTPTFSLGSATFTGTPAQVTTAIDALIFTPTEHQVAVTKIETTTFTISVSETAPTTQTKAVTNAVTTVNATATDDSPTITGLPSADVAVNDNATVVPLTGVTVGDVDSGAKLNITVTTESAGTSVGSIANGTLSGGNFKAVLGQAGSYAVTGVTYAVATADLAALVFKPTAHQITPEATENTVLAITISDSISPPATASGSATITTTAVNSGPVISGTSMTAQTVKDNLTIATFSSKVTITDPNANQTETVTVSLSNSANGTFTAASLTASGFVAGTGTGTGGNGIAVGSYQLSGGTVTAAAATTAIRQLIFQPTQYLVAPALTFNTAFTITVTNSGNNSGSDALTVSDAKTNVTTTAVEVAPTLTLIHTTGATNDETAMSPFTGAAITDPDTSGTQTVTATVTESKSTLGSLSGTAPAGVTESYAAGVETLTGGTAAAVTTALDALTFTPTPHVIALGTTNTVETLTIVVVDASKGKSATTNDSTAITITPVDDGPTGLTATLTTATLKATPPTKNAAPVVASGTSVVTLKGTGPDVGAVFIYSLVSGTGDANNSDFALGSGTKANQLLTTGALGVGTYDVLVQVTDQGGKTFDQTLTITINATTVCTVTLG